MLVFHLQNYGVYNQPVSSVTEQMFLLKIGIREIISPVDMSSQRLIRRLDEITKYG